MNDLTELGKALVDLNEEKVHELVKRKLEAGEDPMAIIQECNAGMVEVGRRFETSEFFISELVIGGTLCNEEVRLAVGADHFATDASKGVRICDEIYGE